MSESKLDRFLAMVTGACWVECPVWPCFEGRQDLSVRLGCGCKHFVEPTCNPRLREFLIAAVKEEIGDWEAVARLLAERLALHDPTLDGKGQLDAAIAEVRQTAQEEQ